MIQFTGTCDTDTENNILTCYETNDNTIYINVKDENSESWIYLDRETSIQLSKQLRRSISLLKNDGNNG